MFLVENGGLFVGFIFSYAYGVLSYGLGVVARGLLGVGCVAAEMARARDQNLSSWLSWGWL